MIHIKTGAADLAALERQADLFQAMASPVRIAIMRLLAGGELEAGAIVDALAGLSPLASVERTNVSKHLSILREQGVVSARGEATRRVYRLETPCLLEALDCVLEGACACRTRPTKGGRDGR